MSTNRDDDPRYHVEGSAWSGPDSVDLKPYFGKMKIVLGFLVLVMIGVQAWQLWSNPVYREIQFGLFGQGILWGENAMWEKSYQTCLEWYDPSRGCTADITPWRFMLTIVDSYWMNYLLYLVTLIILPSIFLFWRRPAPIRCNKALKAIYSWRRRRLFIHSGHYIEFKQKNFYDAIAQSSRRGPAVIELTDSRNPARKGKFKVGPYVSRLESQPARLLGQMRNFLLGYEGPTLSEARPRRLSYPFWEWSLLPPRRLPADIDAQAERWLREHGLHPDDAEG
ncbi:hypothetical protein [Paracoccus onubensis]|uniref:Uncharacterized protein n=1 Tax=Paracoccus onubensis TaxID=1675788 RepID=A0A418SUK6_9RHOB|nr:hypothetical protein [Paracoccus onubensis]RJE84568.1 hypothetical protein D3P04_13045 [Paracoccus onubensis]